MEKLINFFLKPVIWYIFTALYAILIILIVAKWSNNFENSEASTQLFMACIFYGAFYLVIMVARATYIKENKSK